jgi:hypothetical protein
MPIQVQKYGKKSQKFIRDLSKILKKLLVHHINQLERKCSQKCMFRTLEQKYESNPFQFTPETLKTI